MELISATLFADPASPACRRFVARLFSVREVESLALHGSGAEIRYAAPRTTLPRLVRRIAGALARRGGSGVAVDLLYLTPSNGAPLHVRRYGRVLSTWEIRHSLPGRLRLSHPGLRGRRGLAETLVEELTCVPGVLECRAGVYTGTLLVRHDPGRLDRDDVLRLCESALHAAEHRGLAGPSMAKFGVGGALLGLAVAGHFLYPPLLAACALLLVGANVGTFRRAWKSLRAGATDTDVVYSTLILLTVLAGDFLSIALMAWSVAAWPLFLDRRLAATRHALAGDRRRLASLVRIRRAGTELMVPAASLRAGDVTVVETGAPVPVDGRVLEGTATVDERRVTGAPDVTDRTPGQPVYAGSRVVDGRLVIEATRAHRETVETETRRRLIESARVEPTTATPAGTVARRAAPPVLALSAVGAVTGGLGTAIAILAPNYSAAPGLAFPLDRSATLMACANAGFLVRDEAALLRLAQVDAVVIDPAAGEPEAAALTEGLRDRGIERVLVAAPTSSLLRRLRRQGFKVALVGDGRDLAVAREADVAIALGGVHLPAADRADVVLVTPRLAGTLDLVDLARMHVRESRVSRHLGLWPNVVAVGGALVMGFASLHCTALTNLGALLVYRRGNRRLREAEAAWHERQP